MAGVEGSCRMRSRVRRPCSDDDGAATEAAAPPLECQRAPTALARSLTRLPTTRNANNLAHILSLKPKCEGV